MDVTQIISELRSEREDIERKILSLERIDRLSTGTTEGAVRSVAEIRRVKGVRNRTMVCNAPLEMAEPT